MWMNDVAAAWYMSVLTRSPMMVALVQTAATLPIFLLGVPSGALADIVERRRLLIVTQAWAALVALILFVTQVTGLLNPTLLLLLVFANGMVLALRWPVFSAVIAELVPPEEFPAASALSGVANNGARVLGPLFAGLIIASLGTEFVFAANVVLSLLAALLLARWSYERKASALPSERFVGAMRIGVQHVLQSRRMHHVLLRSMIYFLHMIAVIALLPLVAHDIEGGNAGTFSVLIAAMGLGAISGVFVLPAANRSLQHERRFAIGTLLFCVGTLGVALATTLWIAIPALFLAGIAFMLAANTLMVACTTSLPAWVRARGLAIYQMGMMGASAVGAALWGYLATLFDVQTALMISAAVGVVGLVAAQRARLLPGSIDEPGPADLLSIPVPERPVDPDSGPVLVTVEYRIDPSRTDEFIELMRESRQTWLQNGILAWSLFSDVAQEGRHIEHMVDESWAAYLRRSARVSADYMALRERKRGMHIGEAPPVVSRYIAQKVRV